MYIYTISRQQSKNDEKGEDILQLKIHPLYFINLINYLDLLPFITLGARKARKSGVFEWILEWKLFYLVKIHLWCKSIVKTLHYF
jgi:hypothetical protein